MFPARRFEGKTVALFGLARSGLACAEALRAGGAEVLAWDDSAAAVASAEAAGAPIADLRGADFSRLDALVLSPGVPLTHPSPHWTVRRARDAGVEIIGDTEVFAREIEGTGAELIAITGTNGKSTTTALTGHVLRAAGRNAEIGGNIGTAAFLLAPPLPGRIYVLELSSYQIDLMPSLKPRVGVLLNLSPDHLDRHGSMEAYAAVKARMFARQGPGDTAIVSLDDPWCEAIARDLGGPDVVAMSVERILDDGVCAPDGVLRDRRGGITVEEVDLKPMRSLRGRHNWQNACAAYAAARAVGLDAGAIAEGMASFPGLAHRMQEVGRIGPVAFINDSKATNADAAARALAAFDTIYWIAGGRAKSGGIEELSPYFGNVVRAYLIGEAADDFAHVLNGRVDTVKSATVEQAVADAGRDAIDEGRPGAAVLLSPACASFDQFASFEVRGEAFCAAVRALEGFRAREGDTVPC
ncbi:MAG: UDP-N-acetylmuramoyl-L-alanine--D-glutamate ligase [Hyphomicrobiales bacterium]